MIRNAAFFTSILFAASIAFAQISSSDAAKKLHTLFDEDWQWTLKEYLRSRRCWETIATTIG